MTDKPGDAVIFGKKFAGEKFVTVKSVDDHVEAAENHKKFGEHPEAIPLSVYFANKRINDPVVQSMMSAFTKVEHATMAAFDEIFSKF